MRKARVSVVFCTIMLALVAQTPAHAVNVPHSVIVSDDPVAWTPHVLDGKVLIVVQMGNKLIAGGQFTRVQEPGGPELSRTNVFAFDATTGDIDTSFAPSINGVVEALAAAPDGQSVFVGGTFDTVNGVVKKRITKLNTTTGQIVPGFNLTVNSGASVEDLVVRGTRLFLGGAFSKLNGVTRGRLAAVDATTGAVDPNLNLPFTVHHNGGTLRVEKFDVTPDSSRLVAIGNFRNVAGLDRGQIAVIDLTTTPATVANWDTDRYEPQCAGLFDTYMRDIDISPDGTYFVVVTTGAYMGGPGAGVLCDTAVRWEVNAAGSGLQPTWVDYSGGDSFTGVGITGTAIYAGGHQRWMNNPFAGDQIGPGAVSRNGIAALDPSNGLPYSWNPGRTRGRGAFALVSNPQGLWVGSDTTSISGEYHARIAFMPVAGGTAVPPANPGTLPGNLFTIPNGCGAQDTSILYRVNAAGPVLPALDCGPGWSADDQPTNPLRNTGSNAASWGPIGSVHPSVPPTTPSQVYSSERWDPSDLPEMEWHFPVTAGTNVKIRLYMGNQYSGTSQPGQRVFNVSIDNLPALTNYDIAADVGHQVGTMKEFTRVSDGTIDITFGHVVENPLINAIEIINPDVQPPPTGSAFLVKRTFDGTTAGPPMTVSTPGVDWARARGGFQLSGRFYYGWDDGKMYVRTFDGVNLGPAVELNLNGLTATHFPIASVTGMFFDKGRLYYTVAGDARLFYRYFTDESRIIGAETFVASGDGDGLNWSTVTGMTMASGRMYYALPDGNLYGINFSSGRPVPGTQNLISGPAKGDGQVWGGRGMFVFSGS
ncbi:hypothetical protein BH20ACT24_BH20ACT24_16650 [soil metagenome]